MEIMIKSSSIQFKNPQIGQPTRAVEAHYNGRRVTALVNGEDELYRFDKDELPFNSDEDNIVAAIERKVEEKKEVVEEAE